MISNIEHCAILQNFLGYKFKTLVLLEEALTHPSLSSRRNRDVNPKELNYERLEFLGDSVLGLIIAEMLLRKFPTETEGEISKRKSALVCGSTLAKIALTINLGNFIFLSPGEEAMGGRNNPTNLENALEALIGALYLDGDIEIVRHFVKQHWTTHIDSMKVPPKDSKTTLQEWAQKHKLPTPEYKLIKAEGADHALIFTVEVHVNGLEPEVATGTPKKEVEKKAAKKMLAKIEQPLEANA